MDLETLRIIGCVSGCCAGRNENEFDQFLWQGLSSIPFLWCRPEKIKSRAVVVAVKRIARTKKCCTDRENRLEVAMDVQISIFLNYDQLSALPMFDLSEQLS
jgi:hypothetical protein